MPSRVLSPVEELSSAPSTPPLATRTTLPRTLGTTTSSRARDALESLSSSFAGLMGSDGELGKSITEAGYDAFAEARKRRDGDEHGGSVTASFILDGEDEDADGDVASSSHRTDRSYSFGSSSPATSPGSEVEGGVDIGCAHSVSKPTLAASPLTPTQPQPRQQAQSTPYSMCALSNGQNTKSSATTAGMPSPLIIGAAALRPRSSSRNALANFASVLSSTAGETSPITPVYFTAPLHPPLPYNAASSPSLEAATPNLPGEIAPPISPPRLAHSTTAPPALPPAVSISGFDTCTTPTPSSATTAIFAEFQRDSVPGSASGSASGEIKRKGSMGGKFEGWKKWQRYSLGHHFNIGSAKDFIGESQPPSAVSRAFQSPSPSPFASSSPSAAAIPPLSFSSSASSRPHLNHRKTHSGSMHALGGMGHSLGVGLSPLIPPAPGTASPSGGINKRSSLHSGNKRFSWGLGSPVLGGSPVLSSAGSNSAALSGLATPMMPASREDLKELEDFGVRVVDRFNAPAAAAPVQCASMGGASVVVGAATLRRHASGGSSRGATPGLSRQGSNTSTSGGPASTKRRRSEKRTVGVAPSSSGVLSPTAGKNISRDIFAGAAVEIDNGGGVAVGKNKAPVGLTPRELGEKLARSSIGGKGKGRELGERSNEERLVLVIDGRSLASYLGPSGRIKGSINVNFPSLLVKRFRKGNTGRFQLDSFITTEAGKRHYASFIASSSSLSPSTPATMPLAELDIIVVDEHLDDRDIDSRTSTGTGVVLLGVLQRLSVEREWKGGLFFLKGGFGWLASNPVGKRWLVEGESERADGDGTRIVPDVTVDVQDMDAGIASSGTANGLLGGTNGTWTDAPKHGLLRLQPSGPMRPLPKIETENVLGTPLCQDSLGSTPGLSPQSGSSGGGGSIGVPCSGSGKARPPKLRRIDTSKSLLGLAGRGSTPKGNIATRTPPASQAPPGLSLQAPPVPPLPTPPESGQSLHELCRVQSHTPTVPAFGIELIQTDSHAATNLAGGVGSSMPITPAPTTHPETVFSISTIIPNFLYLGSEPSKPEDYKHLEGLGVKRVLNLALECTDEEPECRRRFVKYHFVPMRDFVEEVGVQARIDEANHILDDASLHSQPVYVHCHAGKSRSVTIVLAYLIHRYRWNLKQAYAHVSERRKGISPNIGFLAELMTFEERCGSKASGMIPSDATPATAGHLVGRYRQSLPPTMGRKPSGRVRESLPVPVSTHKHSSDYSVEVRAANDGTWRPARQDPMSERFTVTRRSSRAGLESSIV